MFVMVDIEADGPIPGDFSMISLGAVIVEPSLSQTFYGTLRPISDRYVEAALAVSGHSRQACLSFPEPAETMRAFGAWLQEHGGKRPMFVSDNNGFDWMFVCWYFHHFTGSCPFGHSSTNLGSLYKGLAKDFSQSFRHLRKTAHTHHPVDDAKGNAEALLAMKHELGLKIGLK